MKTNLIRLISLLIVLAMGVPVCAFADEESDAQVEAIPEEIIEFMDEPESTEESEELPRKELRVEEIKEIHEEETLPPIHALLKELGMGLEWLAELTGCTVEELEAMSESETAELYLSIADADPDVEAEPIPPVLENASNIAGGNCGDQGDNVKWSLNSSGKLTITGKGKMQEYDYLDEDDGDVLRTPWEEYFEIITSVEIGSGVTGIGAFSFIGCTAMRSIKIPDTVTRIGESAFEGCESLESVTIPGSVSEIAELAFMDCLGLTNVTIKNGVTSIDDDTFWGCCNLLSIEIPNSVTSIGEYVFCDCESLTSIEIPSSVTRIGACAFAGCNVLTIGVYRGSYAEQYCIDNKLNYNVLPDDSPSEPVSENIIEATCKTEGSYDSVVYCSVCGRELSRVKTKIAKKPHTPAAIAAKEATCTEAGMTAGTYCSVCNEILEETKVIPAKGHTEVVLPRVEPTYETTGLTEGRYCSVCRKILQEQSVIPSLASEIEQVQIPSAITLGVQETMNLKTIVLPENIDAQISYKSSNTKIVSVDSARVLTAKKIGTATVTVTAQNEHNTVSGQCKVTVKKAPSSVKMSAKTSTLGVGCRLILKATLSGGSASSLSWTSTDESVAVVDAGVVDVVGVGAAKIQVRTYNGKTAGCTITAQPAPAIINLNVAELLMGKGQTFQLKNTMEPADAFAGVVYSTSNSAVAAVSAGGKITAKGMGEAVITVRSTASGVEDSVYVEVNAAPGKVILDSAKKTLGVGETFLLNANFNSADSYSSLTWSSKSSVAKVDANGLVTAVKTGTATIKVKTFNGKTASCKITVKKKPTAVSLDQSNLLLGVGETRTLKAGLSKDSASAITWTSGNERVASVRDGVITTVGIGTAVVSASTYNGLRADCLITVREAPASIRLSETERLMSVGQKFTLGAAVNDGAAGSLTYISENTACAAVDGNGMVTAKKVGTTAITVSTYNGISAVCTVTIVAAPTKVSLNKTAVTVDMYDSFRLTATVISATAPTTLTWSSSNKAVADVDQDGFVTAGKAGTAKITVKTHNGKSSTCTVTVRRNFLDLIEPKPTWRAAAGGEDFFLKSVEFISRDELICELYYVNGYSNLKRNYFSQIEVHIGVYDEETGRY